MPGPLLATKLHVPRGRRDLVPRPRLRERLDRSSGAALTLVSAPAGFGKTTLLTDWLSTPGSRGTVAWLSLDPRDNDPVVFWTYVLSAVRTATPDAGAGALALLESSHASLDEVLATLLNDLGAVPHDVVLVLDDFHAVEARDVHAGVAFLLEHLPPSVHLVIATRADPPLPLARLRARGELVEIRAEDLRFTPDEAAAYLDAAVGPGLTARDVAALEARTEGWIAALQLAALSLQGRDDVAGFIADFAGDDRYIVDYLVEEVLERQPADVRTFLLETSVLSRLTGALVDAVTGQDDGRARLAALDRANLFLVPLDDRRHWYRYHHLFADVLGARLLDEWPDRVQELHRRASSWFEENQEPPEAIRHALAAGDAERAADLVELAMPAMRRSRQETTLRRWLEALPDSVFADRPLLSTTYAGALLMHGELEGVDDRLHDAELWVDAHADARADDALVRQTRSQIALYRAAQARVRGDLAGTTSHALRVLDLAGADDSLVRGAAAGLLGLAHWSRGDLTTAHRWWSDSRADLERAGHHSDTLGVSLALADIRLAQGRLRDAMATYERGLSVATTASPPLRGAADMHVGMGEVFLERGDVAAARRHLAASADLGEHAGLPQNRHRWRLATARVRAAEGDLEDAVGLLDEAERVYVGDLFPDVRPIAAVRARVWLAQGRVDRAFGWARDHGLSVEDDLSYLREFEHVTLARALLTVGERSALGDATSLLERLLQAAEAGGRTRTVVELLVLSALAQRAAGDGAGAAEALRRALSLAEPEGYLRVFVDEGAPMTALLTRQEATPYVRRLRAAYPAADAGVPAQRGLIDPLSARELDVLRLLGTDLDGPGIARELVVSLNTVRTHTKNIYAKLGVNSRRAAVRRAAELDLPARVRR